MSLVYSAFVPHSPLLIPTIGKENLPLLSTTLATLGKVREHLYESKPDLVVFVSPHGELRDSIQGFVAEHLTTDFKQFGDLTYVRTYPSSYFLLYQVKKKLRKIPFTLVTDEQLDYGVGAPLVLLTDELRRFPLLTALRVSTLDEFFHYRFGEAFGEEIAASDKRIAVIASGELSHSHSEESLRESSKAFDHTVIQKIKQKDIEILIKPLKEEVKTKMQVCGLKPLVLLFGILGNSRYRPLILSYEHPFGVGLLTVEFVL